MGVKKGIIELFDDKKRPNIYRVIHSEILEMINIDSDDEQLRQVYDFRDKNSPDGYSDGYSDVEKKKIRKVENKTENTVTNEPTKSISFNGLLAKQCGDKWPSFEDVSYLAQLAVENCEDFEADRHTISTLERHLLGQVGKPTKKQKEHVSNLAERFRYEAEKIINLKQVNDIELRQPEEITVKKLDTPQVDEEDMAQRRTLNAIKGMGGNEKIRLLKAKLENAETEEDKYYLQKEIELWEGILC